MFIRQRSSVAIMDSSDELILESILETKAATILQFIDGCAAVCW